MTIKYFWCYALLYDSIDGWAFNYRIDFSQSFFPANSVCNKQVYACMSRRFCGGKNHIKATSCCVIRFLLIRRPKIRGAIRRCMIWCAIHIFDSFRSYCFFFCCCIVFRLCSEFERTRAAVAFETNSLCAVHVCLCSVCLPAEYVNSKRSLWSLVELSFFIGSDC